MLKKDKLLDFKDRVRVRVCGILEKQDAVLLIKHTGIGKDGFLWSPPGGGLEFGDTVEERLIKEFKEETNLTISVKEFLFVNEHMSDRLQAIELFFSVKLISGNLGLGIDPELSVENQILEEIKFFSYQELKNTPSHQIHSAFQKMLGKKSLTELKGFVKFGDI